MDDFLKEMMNIKGFKPILFVAKAFIENFVETSTNPEKPSKFDFGPVNTIISKNFVDGYRLRLSGQTTANLNPHIFASYLFFQSQRLFAQRISRKQSYFYISVR